MFKSKIIVSVLLAGVVCGSVAWAFPSVSGTGALIFVLVKKFERKRKGKGGKNANKRDNIG